MGLEHFGTKEDLKELMSFISDNIRLPILGFGGGTDLLVGDPAYHDVAIGTVIPGWLYADGSEYNIADYPQLAAHYASHHGAANFYGGDGITTFAVPDLRGEFIRGCGTNGHANQGSGANVGVHQDGTIIPSFAKRGQYNDILIDIPSTNEWISTGQSDYNNSNGVVRHKTASLEKNTDLSTPTSTTVTTRPTNTSYPIYIKATVGHTYSTDEQPVGTDENGDVIYQRVVKFTMNIINDKTPQTKQIDLSSWGIAKFVNVYGTWESGANLNTCWQTADLSTYYSRCVGGDVNNHKILDIKSNRGVFSEMNGRVVVEYTKTS